ncbi:MAG: CpaF family protein [Lachnospiraceae bacterium]|nr:CpaF family protein [Lachnospiraceae bacterium]
MDYESNIALLKDTVRDNIQFIQYEAENGTDDDTKLLEYIDECILEIPEYITLRDRIRLRNDVYNSLRRYDVLSELLEDDSISDIMINGAGDIFIEHNGHMERSTKVFENTRKLEDIIQILVAGHNRIVNESNPIADVRLKDGSRVNIVLPPIAIDGPVVTIRKFPKMDFTMEKYIEIGTITVEAAHFLEDAVKNRMSMIVSGGTGSGKTTFLNVLSGFIPADERVITIEDSAELRLQNIKNLVRMETRNANIEGDNEVDIRSLIKTSLRMRPDRIIVGEVRGREAIDMLQAMNTGHNGSLSTCHANSATDLITRLETLVLLENAFPIEAVRRQISSALDIIVHVGRMPDKSRKLMEITEVLRKDNDIILNPIFKFDVDSNKLVKRGEIACGK